MGRVGTASRHSSAVWMTESMTDDGWQNRARRTEWRTALRIEWRAEWKSPATRHLGLSPATRNECMRSKGNRRPDDWLGICPQHPFRFPVSLCSLAFPVRQPPRPKMGRVGTASRHSLHRVGLSALAQPRLTKGGQPYLGPQLIIRFPVSLWVLLSAPTANRYPLTATTLISLTSPSPR